MISLRLVRLIETEADALSDSLLRKFYSSSHTEGLRKIPEHELRERCIEIYAHLTDWLLHKSTADVERRFQSIGELRARQGVPLGDVVWGILLTKEHLWTFLEHQGFLMGPVELHGELELLRLMDHFFDRGVYSTTMGYERFHAKSRVADAIGKERRRGEAHPPAGAPSASL
jgi:hypothetical protein